MSEQCWNVVSWSKRGLALETPLLKKLLSSNRDSDSEMLNVPSSNPPSTLLRLPPELRTRIFELCVNDATLCPRCFEHHEIVADVSRNMQIRGIGPFPLLFTNKQTHNELVSLVYSRLEPVAINGYFLVFQERVTSFLPHSYPAFWPKHPHVQRFARKVTINMAYWKTWGDGTGSWCDFTSDRQGSESSIDSEIKPGTPFETNRSVIRIFAKYLRTFSSLCELEVTIELHWDTEAVTWIHGLAQLLPLYDLRNPNTTFKFDISCKAAIPQESKSALTLEYRNRTQALALGWMQAWRKALADTERQVPETEIVTRVGKKGLHFVATCVTKFQ